MKNNDPRHLVHQFAEAVIGQNKAIMNGDHKLGNKYAKKYIDCHRKLTSIGNVGREELTKLFNHDDPGVKEMAAVFSLKYKTEEALRILNELSKIDSLIGFGAQEAIKRWTEGKWNLDS